MQNSFDIGDPYWAPPPERPFANEVGADPGNLRIAYTTEAISGVSVHPDCIQAVRETAALCADLGHEVTQAAPKISGESLTDMFSVLWSSSTASTLNILKAKQDQVEPLSWALYEKGCQISAPEYMQTITALQRVSRQFARFFVEYDLLLTPTLAEPPVPLGTFDATADDPMKGFRRSKTFVPFTPICNVTGQPAMSVPLFWNKEGLPVGSHFVARFGDEATLFRLAAQLEEFRPWKDKIPPVSVLSD